MVEFDPSKNLINLERHGISLARATDLEVLFAFPDRRKEYGEVRILAYGYIDNLPYVLCYVDRGENMRAISLRRAHKKELQRHGKESQN